MAKRISSGEPKPRRTPTRRRSAKTPAAETAPIAQSAAEAASPATEPTTGTGGLDSPGGAAGEADTSVSMTSVPPAPVAAAEPVRALPAAVAQATSSPEIWGREGAKPDRDAIARRAFELFLARGGAHGHDKEDWLAAERELRRR